MRMTLFARFTGLLFGLLPLTGCEVRTHARLVLLDGFAQHDGERYPFRSLSDSEANAIYPRLDDRKSDTLIVANADDLRIIFCAACQFNVVVATNTQGSVDISVGGEAFELVHVQQPSKSFRSQEKLSKASGRLRLQGEAADGVFGAAFSVLAPSTYDNYGKTFRLKIPVTVDSSVYSVQLTYKFEKKRTLKESIGVPGTP